jgi:SAM-dependent methyltransferase
VRLGYASCLATKGRSVSRSYEEYWDRYVDRDWPTIKERSGALEWPGDEWGDPAGWKRFFDDIFRPHVESWERAVEVGPGSGKYTSQVLEHVPEVRAYDVSAKFLEVCRARCAEAVASGRLDLRHLDSSDPGFMLRDLDSWRRTVDGFYSIDAMVHVDLQYVTAYLITAAAVLKPGGKLIMTFGTAGTEAGFVKLLEDVERYWDSQGEATGRFEWVSGSLMESLLPRFGFAVDLAVEYDAGTVLPVVASLARPGRGDELTRYLL